MSWLMVAVGGALGALGRYGVIHLLPQINPLHFPWAIWIVNLIGSCLAGIVYVLITEKGLIPVDWRPLLVVGLLGAFTTFSSFALDSFLLWQGGRWYLAIIYSLSTLLSCSMGVAISVAVTRRFFTS